MCAVVHLYLCLCLNCVLLRQTV